MNVGTDLHVGVINLCNISVASLVSGHYYAYLNLKRGSISVYMYVRKTNIDLQ